MTKSSTIKTVSAVPRKETRERKTKVDEPERVSIEELIGRVRAKLIVESFNNGWSIGSLSMVFGCKDEAIENHIRRAMKEARGGRSY